MNTSIQKAVELKNIHYTVESTHIIKDITGFLAEGKITTLVGPSGAGKTTLFRLMNGLISPTKGEIKIFGTNIENYEPTDLRRTVGIALQHATMLRGNLYENLSVPKKLKGENLLEEDALSLLEAVGLEKELLKRNVKDLSGGQRQKTSIARTLVNRPKILLLDEITSALDRVSKEDIEQLIVKINKEFDVTIFWITHNLQQAREIGDNTWVIMDGKLIESGPSSLLEDPQNELVNRFVKGEFE